MKDSGKKRFMLLLILAFMVLLLGGARKSAVAERTAAPCLQAAGSLVSGTVSSSPAEWSKAAAENPLWLIEISAE